MINALNSTVTIFGRELDVVQLAVVIGLVALILILAIVLICLIVKKRKHEKAIPVAEPVPEAAKPAPEPEPVPSCFAYFDSVQTFLSGLEGADSRRREIFTRDGKLVAELVMRGRTPVLYLPFKAEELWEGAEDCTEVRGLEKTPLCVRVESEEALKSAFNVIKSIFVSYIPYSNVSRVKVPEEGTYYERIRKAILSLPKVASRKRAVFAFGGEMFAEVAISEGTCKVYLPMSVKEAEFAGHEAVDCSGVRGLEETPCCVPITGDESYAAATELAQRAYEKTLAKFGFAPMPEMPEDKEETAEAAPLPYGAAYMPYPAPYQPMAMGQPMGGAMTPPMAPPMMPPMIPPMMMPPMAPPMMPPMGAMMPPMMPPMGQPMLPPTMPPMGAPMWPPVPAEQPSKKSAKKKS